MNVKSYTSPHKLVDDMFSLLLVQAGKVGNGEPGAARVTSAEEADEAKRKEKLKRGREVINV